jgi:hypothetical protein
MFARMRHEGEKFLAKKNVGNYVTEKIRFEVGMSHSFRFFFSF